MARRIGSLSDLAGEFDGFILDQWGVLHDGTNPYDGAAESLARMRAAGKKVVILSNSGRLSAYNRSTLSRMGIPADLYQGLVTAGDAARQALATRPDAAHRALGRRCLALARPQDSELFDGLGLEMVGRVADAEFLCVVGFEQATGLVGSVSAILDESLARRLPMVCANPDFARLTPTGVNEAAGVVARAYEARGGTVLWHGKPHPSVYAESRRILDPVAWNRVVAVGDSVDHDIRGAAAAGLRSVFVAGGVHMEELQITFGALPSDAAWQKFMATAPAQPDYLAARFGWTGP